MNGFLKIHSGWILITIKNHIQKRMSIKVKGLGFMTEPEDESKIFTFLPPSYNLNIEDKVLLKKTSNEFRMKLMENYTNMV